MRDVMFHGSWQSGLTRIEPVTTRIRGKEESLIFGSPSLAFISCFLMDWEDDWCHLFAVNNRKIYFTHHDREKFKAQSARPGSIYVMRAGDFRFEPALGKDKIEWVARQPCTPLFEIPVPASGEIMRRMGIELYHASREAFAKLCAANSKQKKCRLLKELAEKIT